MSLVVRRNRPHRRALPFAALFLCVASPFWAAEYAGSQACAPCHPSEFQKQSASHHAHSLQPIEGSLVGAALLKAGHSPDGRLRYEQSAGHILVHEEGAPQPVVLEWAFGAGAQGSTPVGLLGEQFIEHRFSYYSRTGGLAPTFGHPPRASTPIAELGVLQDKRTISNCFNCHATGLQRSGSEFSLTGLRPGVQCERCHGPGSMHIQAAERSGSKEEVRKEVVNPGRLPARAQIEICGQCHRLPMPGMGEEPELEDPVTVRFAPIGLLASKCFRASKTISCLTCHDPHSDARPRTDSFYSEKCLACHATDHKPVKLCRRVQKENCLPCHMQQARLKPYLQFTDHRIRIY
jgi:Cytochrome c554 and c-prime